MIRPVSQQILSAGYSIEMDNVYYDVYKIWYILNYIRIFDPPAASSEKLGGGKKGG